MKITLVFAAVIIGFLSMTTTALAAETAKDKILDSLMVKGWPAAKISKTIPPYTDGKVENSGGDQTTYYIKVHQTSKKGLETYLETLRKAGWIVNGGNFPEADKELVPLKFSWESSVNLQITARQSKQGTWPTSKLPPEISAPAGARFEGDVLVREADPGRAWYFTFKCLGMNEDAAHTWLRSLLASGWAGDESQLSRKFTWNAKKINANLEIYETNSDSSIFTYNYSVDED